MVQAAQSGLTHPVHLGASRAAPLVQGPCSYHRHMYNLALVAPLSCRAQSGRNRAACGRPTITAVDLGWVLDRLKLDKKGASKMVWGTAG